ncbi:MAG: REC domain-containing diguanylate cyclase [Gammaproteobacteria bacterium CG22_combo_CG10-13_8_21_14_all_40_8]|nr:MAG: REC domain-containing diguanylate cyclase [Gammaproteobacteria bacterium CG22_combo_CG10-13_8_21_14_all_40_8]
MPFKMIAQNIQGSEILIVDDTPANIDLLYKILTQKGYKVAAAPNGEIALKIAPKLQPDLILLDVMMPHPNGIETCRLLKQAESTANIPVIFVTAKTEVADIVEGFAAGAVDYISKPIKQEEVLARIATHLKIQSLTRHQEQLVEMLQDYEVRNRAIINEIAQAIITLVPPDLIESANPAALALFGCDEKGLVGQHFLEFLQGEDKSAAQEFLSLKQAATLDRRFSNEVVLASKHRSQFTAKLNIEPLSLNYPLFVCHLQDLTESKKVIQQLIDISNVDKLTNISNRRRFEEFFENSWKNIIAQNGQISLIMADIDFFKQYNDEYGHQQGDDCLKMVAECIATTCKNDNCLVARYGGEEFVIVLPQYDADKAKACAEFILNNIRQLKIPHVKSNVMPIVTLSLGICTMQPNAAVSRRLLIEGADSALYKAKKQGRNRVVALMNNEQKDA